jgi:cytoskeleton protein RodZ
VNEQVEKPPDPAAPAAPAPEAAAVPAPAPVARSIGERLRAGRNRSGLSIAAAAEKLHLDPKVIEALEADRFAEVGASVYVRGHLKRYADFVGEPGAELVAMYSTRETRTPKPDLTQVPTPERRADPRRLVTPFVALGCGAVLVGAVWWVLAGSRTPRVAPAPVVASEPVTVNSGPLAATPTSLTNTPMAAVETQTPPAGEVVAETTPAAPVKEAPAREIRLRLELTNDSWVEVYDSRGARLFYDVATAGSVQSMSGSAPLRVVLENAAGVSVEVDGQVRDIPANAVDGERARFVINRSGSLSRARQ